MNFWMIAAILLALAAAVLAVVCIRQHGKLEAARAQQENAESFRRDAAVLRGENARWRRENAALHRALENEQAYSDDMERALADQQRCIEEAERRADQANARRIEAERAVSAGRMRADLLEGQLTQLQKEQRAQEQLYQDILRDRDDVIARLQDQHQKRRARKKAEALDQQITISDILKGM